VGEGGQTTGIEVKRIQQLLTLAGNDPGPITSLWNPKTKQALLDFVEDLQWGPTTPYIDPQDPYYRLFTLAYSAGVLLDLPKNLRSESAALALYETCRERRLVYGWTKGTHVYNGGTRTIWGYEWDRGYAVATKGYARAEAEFDLDVPISLNCTGFANLMLSVWRSGAAHEAPYDRSQGVGGFNPLGARYSMQPAPGFYVLDPPGVYKSLDTILSSIHPSRVYYFGICNGTGFISHDMVYFGGKLYECNLDKTPAVYSTPLEDKIKVLDHGHYFTIYGPGPF